jgi:hypothetical protein
MGNGAPDNIRRIIAGLLARYPSATTGAEHDELMCRLDADVTAEDYAALRALGWHVEHEPDCIWGVWV